jgi:hypothetical protein
VLPWSAPGLPAGSVQLDFVFGEKLLQEPEPVELPGGGVLLAATPRLSLAWKVSWLVTDAYPQGKDLYDAVLLAERQARAGESLSEELLREALRQSEDWPYFTQSGRLDREDLAELLRYVAWADFVVDHPGLPRDAEVFTTRLLDALEPVLGIQLA